jgi:hypothetical protein
MAVTPKGDALPPRLTDRPPLPMETLAPESGSSRGRGVWAPARGAGGNVQVKVGSAATPARAVWDGSPRVTPVLRNETWNVNHERQWRTWRQAGTGASTTTACARAAPWAPLTRQAETPGPPAARLAGGRGRKEHNHSEPRQAQAFKSPKASVSACVHRFPACVHRGKDAGRGSELSRTFTHCQTSGGSAPPDGPHSRAGRHAAETVGERPRSHDCPPGSVKLVFVTLAPAHSTGTHHHTPPS